MNEWVAWLNEVHAVVIWNDHVREVFNSDLVLLVSIFGIAVCLSLVRSFRK